MGIFGANWTKSTTTSKSFRFWFHMFSCCHVWSCWSTVCEQHELMWRSRSARKQSLEYCCEIMRWRLLGNMAADTPAKPSPAQPFGSHELGWARRWWRRIKIVANALGFHSGQQRAIVHQPSQQRQGVHAATIMGLPMVCPHQCAVQPALATSPLEVQHRWWSPRSARLACRRLAHNCEGPNRMSVKGIECIGPLWAPPQKTRLHGLVANTSRCNHPSILFCLVRILQCASTVRILSFGVATFPPRGN